MASALRRALVTLGLWRGKGRLTTLRRACHAGALDGGLSVDLRAHPDEVLGPLTHAMGGQATQLKVLDSKGVRPAELTVALGELTERWELEDVRGLVHNLNDLFRAQPSVRAVAVLGDWEDMLQLWCVPKPALEKLLALRCLDDAENLATLTRTAEGDAPAW